MIMQEDFYLCFDCKVSPQDGIKVIYLEDKEIQLFVSLSNSSGHALHEARHSRRHSVDRLHPIGGYW